MVKKTSKKSSARVVKTSGSKKAVNENNGVASLILGISGLVFLGVPIIGLVASILALVYAKKQNKISSTGMATAGKVTGIIGVILSSLYLIGLVIFAIFFVLILSSGAVV